MLYDTKFVVDTPKEAALQAIEAGEDMATETYLGNLAGLVREGVIPESLAPSP
jgi:hypothetical protein